MGEMHMLAQITKGDRLILYFERFSRLAFGAKPDNPLLG